jgi:hypothetical protein
MFNYGEGELFAPSVGKFTIPFVANKIEYNDYAIIVDFNTLAKRYWSDINTAGKYVELQDAAYSNLSGVPYISSSEERMESMTVDGKTILSTTNGPNYDPSRPRLSFRARNTDNHQIPEV